MMPVCIHTRLLHLLALVFSVVIAAISAQPSVPMPVDPFAVHAFGGHTYTVIPVPMDWLTANYTAVANSGQLVSINSAAEQDFLTATFLTGWTSAPSNLGGLWIGLHRPCSTCAFEWSDGSLLTFTNWTGPSLYDYVVMGWRKGSKDSRGGAWTALELDGFYTVGDQLFYGIVEFPSLTAPAPPFVRTWTTGPSSALTFDAPPAAEQPGDAGSFTWLPTLDGQAGVAEFDGVRDFINLSSFRVSSGSELTFMAPVTGGAFSLEGRMRWRPFSGDLAKGYLAIDTPTQMAVDIHLHHRDANDTAGVLANVEGRNCQFLMESDRWYHWVWSTRERFTPARRNLEWSAGAMSQFLDGRQCSLTWYLELLLYRPHTPATLGVGVGADRGHFPGWMKGLYYYDYALSAEAALAHSRLPRPPAFELDFATNPVSLMWFNRTTRAYDGINVLNAHFGVLQLVAAARQYVDLNAAIGTHSSSTLIPAFGGAGYALQRGLDAGWAIELALYSRDSAPGVLFSCSNERGDDAVLITSEEVLQDGQRGQALVLRVHDVASQQLARIPLLPSFSAFSWYHVVVAMDAARSRYLVYANGRLASISSASAFPARVARPRCFLGSNTNSSLFGSWLLDAFRLYDYIPPATVVAALANAVTFSPPPIEPSSPESEMPYINPRCEACYLLGECDAGAGSTDSSASPARFYSWAAVTTVQINFTAGDGQRVDMTTTPALCCGSNVSAAEARARVQAFRGVLVEGNVTLNMQATPYPTRCKAQSSSNDSSTGGSTPATPPDEAVQEASSSGLSFIVLLVLLCILVLSANAICCWHGEAARSCWKRWRPQQMGAGGEWRAEDEDEARPPSYAVLVG